MVQGKNIVSFFTFLTDYILLPFFDIPPGTSCLVTQSNVWFSFKYKRKYISEYFNSQEYIFPVK